MRQKSPKPDVYAFIDSQNLNLGVQRNGWKLDWRKFRQYLQKEYNVTHAYMFIGYMSENEALYEHMYELGYLIVLKRTLDVTAVHEIVPEGETAKSPEKSEDKPPFKGNVDAELVLHAMKDLPNYDKAIIVSGDGDFFCLAEYLAEQNKLSHILVPNWQYSSLLKQFESQIVRLDKLRRQLAYRDSKFRRPPKAAL
ncbi:MAG: NYN domain-containing protein [Candidatus Saccharibacteria bacterium]